MAKTTQLPPAFVNAFKEHWGVELDSTSATSDQLQSRNTKPLPPEFLAECEKLVASYRPLLIQCQCEFQLTVANTLLSSRTAAEILEAADFVNALLLDQNDAVDTLNIALDDGQPVGRCGFQSGKKFEYFAVLTLLLATKLQSLATEAPEEDFNKDQIDQAISWANIQVGESIEAAIDHYLSFLFPGREEDVSTLRTLISAELSQKAATFFDHTLLPAILPLVRNAFDVPRVNDVVKIAVADFEQHRKSEAARKAGASPKPSNPQKIEAIRRFKAGTWRSPLQAAREIYPEIARMLNNKLSEGRGEKTVHEWFLAYTKENNKPS